MNCNLAPVAIFAYNRPIHLQKTIEALKANRGAAESDIYIFSDGPKSDDMRVHVEKVRSYITMITGFKSIQIIERPTNYGLAKNIIDGVTYILQMHEKIVVLEDDLLTSPHFLTFVNDGLDKYENEDRVVSIASYMYPIRDTLPNTVFMRGADCLGWATWRRGWKIFEHDGRILLNKLRREKLESQFDFNNSFPYTAMLRDQIRGRNNSWAIRWYASAFLANKLTLYPGKSLIYHNGSDGSGTNCGKDNFFDVEVTTDPIQLNDIDFRESAAAFNAIEKFFRQSRSTSTFLKKLLKKLYYLSVNFGKMYSKYYSTPNP